MTTRDRMLLVVIACVGVLAGFWFGVLAPKREDAKAIDGQIAQAQQRLDAARATAAQAEAAKRRYDADYATVARLGKAVPLNDNVPSLVYQLQSAARSSRVDFRSLQVAQSGGVTAAAPAAAPAPAATNPQGASNGQSGSQPSGQSASTGAQSGQGGAPSSTGASPAPSAPATQAAAASLPPGASVGTAGFPTMPFSFVFTGSFFDMERMLDEINRFISVAGDDVRVRGRLLSIDGISLQPGSRGFPQVKASMTATAYLLPPGEGITGGATATTPGTTQQASGSAGPTTPSSAVVAGVTR